MRFSAARRLWKSRETPLGSPGHAHSAGSRPWRGHGRVAAHESLVSPGANPNRPRSHVRTRPCGERIFCIFVFFAHCPTFVLAVSAPLYDGAYQDQGAAYLFSCSNGGECTYQGLLVASDAAANNFFGISVAVSGDMVVVGANWESAPDYIQTGQVYLFRCDYATAPWTCTEMLKFRSPTLSDYLFFGMSIAAAASSSIVAVASSTNTFVYQCETATQPWSCALRVTIFGYSNAVQLVGATLATGDGSYNRLGRV